MAPQPRAEGGRRVLQGGRLRLFALTDHFWECYGFPVTDTRPLRSKGFTTLLGAEIHAPVTAKGHDWHVVAAGLPLDFAPWSAGETMQAMIRRAAAAGAFLAIAHPQWYGLTVEDALSLPEAHAVEVYNHSCAVECDRGDGLVVLEEALARGARLNACATDDAHFNSPDAGGGWVMVKAEALEPELLLEALKRGDYYSSQGPQIHDIAIEGDEAIVDLLAGERGRCGRRRHRHQAGARPGYDARDRAPRPVPGPLRSHHGRRRQGPPRLEQPDLAGGVRGAPRSATYRPLQ